MQTINNTEQLQNEFKRKGIVTFPFLKADNAIEYINHILGNVPINDWILSASKDIEISPKNINLIVDEWNNKNILSKYFYLPTSYEDTKVFNLFKKSIVLKQINKIIPDVKIIKDPIAMLMTSGCYVKEQNNGGKIRFIWHLQSDWKEEYGGTLRVNNEVVVPKFSYITIFRTDNVHSITQVVDNLEIPNICITGFLE